MVVQCEFVSMYELPAGSQLALVGNIPELGCWSPETPALARERDGLQRLTISLPAEFCPEFKWVVLNSNLNIARWEQGANKTFYVPSNGRVTIHSPWGKDIVVRYENTSTVKDPWAPKESNSVFDYIRSLEDGDFLEKQVTGNNWIRGYSYRVVAIAALTLLAFWLVYMNYTLLLSKLCCVAPTVPFWSWRGLKGSLVGWFKEPEPQPPMWRFWTTLRQCFGPCLR